MELHDLDVEPLSEEDGGDNREGGGYLLQNSIVSCDAEDGKMYGYQSVSNRGKDDDENYISNYNGRNI